MYSFRIKYIYINGEFNPLNARVQLQVNKYACNICNRELMISLLTRLFKDEQEEDDIENFCLFIQS